MNNTLTIEQVGDSLTRAIACLNETRAPVKVMSGGETAAYLVAPHNLIVYDPLITPEEAIVLAHDRAPEKERPGIAVRVRDPERQRVLVHESLQLPRLVQRHRERLLAEHRHLVGKADLCHWEVCVIRCGDHDVVDVWPPLQHLFNGAVALNVPPLCGGCACRRIAAEHAGDELKSVLVQNAGSPSVYPPEERVLAPAADNPNLR
jgi:hypothetical protein